MFTTGGFRFGITMARATVSGYMPIRLLSTAPVRVRGNLGGEGLADYKGNKSLTISQVEVKVVGLTNHERSVRRASIRRGHPPAGAAQFDNLIRQCACAQRRSPVPLAQRGACAVVAVVNMNPWEPGGAHVRLGSMGRVAAAVQRVKTSTAIMEPEMGPDPLLVAMASYSKATATLLTLNEAVLAARLEEERGALQTCRMQEYARALDLLSGHLVALQEGEDAVTALYPPSSHPNAGQVLTTRCRLSEVEGDAGQCLHVAHQAQPKFVRLIPAIADLVAQHSHLMAAVARLRRSVHPIDAFVPEGLSRIGERVVFLEQYAAAAVRAREVLRTSLLYCL